MKYLKERNLSPVLLLTISLILSACSVITQRQTGLFGVEDSEINASNGERIYFTSSSERGTRISYTGGPRFGMGMMGSYLTCAACHGLDGGGGVHQMHMQIMEAPDIRYETLNSELGEHGGNAHGAEEREYSLEDFRLAVTEGQHPDGKRLSRDMPRWRMSEEDLQDLFVFIKSLP